MSGYSRLRELGLNDKEISLYVSLLKHGRKTPAALARLTKINRATVYSVGKSLQSKGIIAEDLSGKSRHLVALPLTSLGQLIDRPRRELEAKERLVQAAIEELSSISKDKEYPIPKIRFIPEEDMKDFLFGNTVKWQQSILRADSIWWGFQDPSFVSNYESWIHSTWTTAESKDKGYKAQVLSSLSVTEQALQKKYPRAKRDVRHLQRANFTSTLWVAGEYMVIVTTQHHPFYLVEIHDQLLSNNLREMFKRLWEMAK